MGIAESLCCNNQSQIKLQKNASIKDVFLEELIKSSRKPKTPERKESEISYDKNKIIKIQKIFKSFSSRKKIKKIIEENRFSPQNIPGTEITEIEFSKILNPNCEEIEKSLGSFLKKINSKENEILSTIRNDNFTNVNNISCGNSLSDQNQNLINLNKTNNNQLTYNNIPLKFYRISYPDNSLYEGYYNYKWQKHGFGSLITKNDTNSNNDYKKITGYFQNDEIKGFCRIIYLSSGDYYEGYFDGLNFSGYGEFTSAGGLKYKGNFLNGLKEGKGEEIFEENFLFSGNFKNDLKNGEGIYKWNDGAIYSGNFINDNIEGIGKLTLPNKSLYIGEWVDNRIEGIGIYFFENNMIYLGEYKNEKKWGFGIFVWPNGYKYEGQWINGKQNGFGIFYADGKTQFSEWRLGIKMEKMSLEDPNEMKSNVIKINFRTFEVCEFCRKLGVEIDKDFTYIKYEDRYLSVNI